MAEISRVSAAPVPDTPGAIDIFSGQIKQFLDHLGLPSNGVFAAADQRKQVINLAPALIKELRVAHRSEAMYLSKFVAACSTGLFDAALNFLWDEVIVHLRSRVVRFDLVYFLDTAVQDADDRKGFKDPEDLQDLPDDALVRGALKCGIISKVAFKHLDHIRDMRNWASAAHPNHAELTGLQLAAWCETCIKEVLTKEPDAPVIEVHRLLENLRTKTVTPLDLSTTRASLSSLPSELITALLRSTFGLYCDPKQEVRVRDNVRLVAREIWELAPRAVKAEVALKYASYEVNADVDRQKLAGEFLDLVDGQALLPDSTKALKMAALVTRLESAHDGLNNFYNEPPVARDIRKFVGNDGVIPDAISPKYVRVLARCRIGRVHGVSNKAVPTYDELLNLFTERQVREFVSVLECDEISSRLRSKECAGRFHEIAKMLMGKVVDRRLQQVYQMMLKANERQLPTLWVDAAFQRAVTASREP